MERRPHARKIINLARFLGALVMPSNRAVAFVVHGLMRAIRVLPAGRALFDDLKVKPENTFDTGLFWRDKRAERLRAGSTLPQGWVRTATDSGPILSDDALGLALGSDRRGRGSDRVPARRSTAALAAARAARSGSGANARRRSISPPPDQRLEALDETLLPHRAPLGWAVIVRPDRCVMAEGPVEQVETMLEQALGRIEPAAHAAMAPDTAWRLSRTTQAS